MSEPRLGFGLKAAAAELNREMSVGFLDAGMMTLDIINQYKSESDNNSIAEQRPGQVIKGEVSLPLPNGMDITVAHATTYSANRSFFFLRVNWLDEREGQESFIHYAWQPDRSFSQRLVNLPPPLGRFLADKLKPQDLSEIQTILDTCFVPTFDQSEKLSNGLLKRVREESAARDPVLKAYFDHAIHGTFPVDETDLQRVSAEVMDMYGLTTLDSLKKAKILAIASLTGTKALEELISGEA